MKKLLIIALITMLSVSMVGCGGADEVSDTIRIGVNYELSGPVATYGSNTVDGIKLAIAEVNAAGGINGKQVEAVILDNKSDPAEALSVATKLIAEERIIALLGRLHLVLV